MPNRWEQSKILCYECVGFESLRRQLTAAGFAFRIPKEAHLVFELTSFQDSNSGNLKRGPTALD